MNTRELIELFRSDVADPILPGGGDDSDVLFKETDILRWLNMGQRRYVKITRQLVDSSSEITNLTVTKDEPFSDISPLIIDIDRGRLVTDRRKLEFVTLHQLETQFYGDDYGSFSFFRNDWESVTGVPRFGVMDFEADKIRWAPVPTITDVANLTVIRYPLKSIVSCQSPMEVTRDEDQYAILDFVKAQAYGQQDADVYDPRLSEDFMAKFLAKADERKKEVQRLHKPPGSVRYGGL